MLHGWQPGTYRPSGAAMSSSGLSVDNYDRNDVVAFWHAVYQASEGYEKRIKWTGNYTGSSGKTSPEFTRDVERRLNFFRAMCGVPANVKVNSGSSVVIGNSDAFKPSHSTTKSQAAQDAALMLVRNYNSSNGSNPAMSHNPPQNVAGWSAAAWNAAAHGNLAFGIFGPGAVSEYMIEEISTGSATSYWNSLVGHRRWCLYPAATDFASGDQPGKSAYVPPTNVLYVSQSNRELASVSNVGFVAYPAAGFFPAPVNSRFWSLSATGADFSSAKVRMTDAAGRTVSISAVQASNSYGDPTLIWTVPSEAAAKSVYQDRKFNVHVTGIKGKGVSSSHSYWVTLINPNRLTASLNLKGSTAPSPKKTTNYKFSPPKGAESLQVSAFLKQSSRWREDAEGKTNKRVIDRTSNSYPLAVNMSAFRDFGGLGGSGAFHLTFPTSFDLIAHGVPEQSFELDREVIANRQRQTPVLVSPRLHDRRELPRGGGFLRWRSLLARARPGHHRRFQHPLRYGRLHGQSPHPEVQKAVSHPVPLFRQTRCGDLYPRYRERSTNRISSMTSPPGTATGSCR